MQKTIQPGAVQSARAGSVLLVVENDTSTPKALPTQVYPMNSHQLDRWLIVHTFGEVQHG
jgi:hypothetical protein